MPDEPENEEAPPTAEAKSDDVDATGATPKEREAKEELFEAIDHFKNAASILFSRATSDPAVKKAGKEVRRVVDEVSDAAEPLAKELTTELGRLTKDIMKAVDGTAKRTARRDEEDEEE